MSVPIDSPSYYFVFDSCSNGEIYNLLVRGIVVGMTDAFDIWGDNIWVRDIEVTNGDECVTLKSPATNSLIENIYCNLSGGTAIGSIGTEANVSNVVYRNLYMNSADACYLKTNNGNGTIENIIWEDVIVHGGPYPLALNEAWDADPGSTGVKLRNLTFKNWYGENAANARPTIRLECDADVRCYDITLENVNLWTDGGDDVYWSCQNAYGTDACLAEADSTTDLATYTTVVTVTTAPSYSAPKMADDLTAAPASNSSFTIPPMPTSFYLGTTPVSALLSLSAAGGL